MTERRAQAETGETGVIVLISDGRIQTGLARMMLVADGDTGGRMRRMLLPQVTVRGKNRPLPAGMKKATGPGAGMTVSRGRKATSIPTGETGDVMRRDSLVVTRAGALLPGIPAVTGHEVHQAILAGTGDAVRPGIREATRAIGVHDLTRTGEAAILHSNPTVIVQTGMTGLHGLSPTGTNEISPMQGDQNRDSTGDHGHMIPVLIQEVVQSAVTGS